MRALSLFLVFLILVVAQMCDASNKAQESRSRSEHEER
jgi:hypothetical protein